MGSLRKNSLSFIETSFQGIAGSAPAGAAVATLTGAAAFALGALPLAAVLGFGVVMLNAVIIRRISLKTAGAGGYYSYIQKGLGTRTAGFSGIYYVFYQIMALCFMGLSTSVFVPAMLSEAFGINIPSIMFYPIILGTLGFGFIMSYAGIRLSARFSLIMAAAEIAAITVIGAVILISHPSLNTPSVFTLSDNSNGLTGLLLGGSSDVYGILRIWCFHSTGRGGKITTENDRKLSHCYCAGSGSILHILSISLHGYLWPS